MAGPYLLLIFEQLDLARDEAGDGLRRVVLGLGHVALRVGLLLLADLIVNLHLLYAFGDAYARTYLSLL